MGCGYKYACESLQWNHPQTKVRSESAEDFLALLEEWERLCASFSSSKSENLERQSFNSNVNEDNVNDEEEEEEERKMKMKMVMVKCLK